MKWLQVSALVCLIGASGCDPAGLEGAARELAGAADKLVDGLGKNVEKAAKESAEWRAFLEAVNQDLKNVPADARIQGMAFTDFAVARLKQNVDKLKAVNDLLEAKKTDEGLQAMMKVYTEFAKDAAPTISTASPMFLKMEWESHERPAPAKYQSPVVQFVGFDLNPNQPKVFNVRVRDEAGKVTRDVTRHFTVSTPYVAQLDLSASGVRFAPGETRVELLRGQDVVAAVPVTWAARPEPQERLKGGWAKFYTTNDDREGGKLILELWSLKKNKFGKHDQDKQVWAVDTGEEGWGEWSEHAVSLGPKEVLTGDEYILFVRLKEAREVNVGWNFHARVVLETDEGRKLVFQGDGLRLDTTGRGGDRVASQQLNRHDGDPAPLPKPPGLRLLLK